MAVVLRTLPGQRHIPFLPREQVLQLRDERVRSLVAYAAANVPYYRELDPRGIRTAKELQRLPVLDKKTVQRDPDLFRPDTRLGREALTLRTAGSTGTPVTVYRDQRGLLENIAYAERERVVETGLARRRYRYPAATIVALDGNLPRVRDFYGRASFRPLRPRHHLISLADPPEEQAKALARIRPLVLRGFGSSLELLFRVALARGWDLHRPAVVVYGGDTMTPAGRRLIESDFGIPVLSRYSAAEAFRIGFTCERSASFHLHEDLCVVSTVDGEIVVTDLVNRGMVLLNYRLGDLGRLGPPGCECGRTSQLLTELAGRSESIVVLLDGTRVHPRLLETALHRRPAVLRFQLVQREPDRFDLRVVTPDEASFARISSDIVDDLRALLHGAAVSVERCDELQASAAGKFRSIVGLASPNELVGA